MSFETKTALLGEITENLDSKRIPLNSSQRSQKQGAGRYPYYGANGEVDRLDEFIFDDEILCVAEDGGSWGQREKCAFRVSGKCWVNNHAHVLVARNGVSLDYLEYYLNYADLNSYVTGTTRGKLNKSALSRIPIPIPPLPEQKRIAAILDKADELRRKRRETIAKLDTLIQSIFLDMFGDPVTNPKGWDTRPLLDVTVGKYGIKAGPFGSSLKKEDYTATGYRIYGQEQVIAGRFDIGDYYIDEEKFDKLRSCAVKPGDLLVSLVGSYGKVLIVPDGIKPGIINPRLLKITPDQDKVLPYFLKELLQGKSIQDQFERMSHGGTMGILNAGILKQLTVPTPPLSVQEKFVACVNKAEIELNRQATSLQGFRDLFTSIQQQCFGCSP